MKPVNISALVKKYGSKYIAKSGKTGKVLASSKRVDLLIKKTKNDSDVTISWVPSQNARYVFKISI